MKSAIVELTKLEGLVIYHGPLWELNSRLPANEKYRFADECSFVALGVESIGDLQAIMEVYGYVGLVNCTIQGAPTTLHSRAPPFAAETPIDVNGTPIVDRYKPESQLK